MKEKIKISFLALFMFAAAFHLNTVQARELDIEILVDNRIEDMGIENNIKYCVKEVTMDELRRRGSIQTYVLDIVIRKIIVQAARYCRGE